MEKLARKLANKIAVSLEYDKEKEAVVAYGLIAMIQVAVTVLLVLLLAILIGAPIEAMIICFSVSILRKYSGGVHAESAELCTFISILYCTGAAYLSKKLLLGIYSPIPMLAAVIAIYGLSYLIVYKYAPVDSPNKPIHTDKKRKRMRRGSFIILSVYLSLSIVFFVLGYEFKMLNSFGISLLFGVSWQVFTLTPLGSNLLGRLNIFFISLRKEAQK